MEKYEINLFRGARDRSARTRKGAAAPFRFLPRRMEASVWDKIDLENFIFYLSVRGKAPVTARRGRLHCAGGTPALRKLLAVYNRFFGKQNQRFLQAELNRNKAEDSDFYRCYEREQRAHPLFPSFQIAPERR